MAEPTAAARLVALVRAGPYRLALPASAVREVARCPPGATVRGLEPLPLLTALGEPTSQVGDWVVVLEAPEPLAVRVDAVEGVRDPGNAPFYSLPAGVDTQPPDLFRGAVAIGGALALELRPERLANLAPLTAPAQIMPHYATEPTPKALVCSLAGRSLGFPLSQVLSVVGKPTICPVPRAAPGRRGVAEHGQTLYPVLDVGALYFERPSTGDFALLVELERAPWLVLADAVQGVRGGFRPIAEGEPGWMQGERGERALFLRLEDS